MEASTGFDFCFGVCWGIHTIHTCTFESQGTRHLRIFVPQSSSKLSCSLAADCGSLVPWQLVCICIDIIIHPHVVQESGIIFSTLKFTSPRQDCGIHRLSA